jgi:glutamine amidotransferase
MIAIVDYQAGNIGSIRNMLKKIGHDSLITSSATEIQGASHIIVPGVGAFDYGMQKLSALGLIEVLNEKRRSSTPILGICLGAQLMCKNSEEGKLPGLGWVPGRVKKFSASENGKKYTVPHMGWDVVEQTKESKLFEDVGKPARFYFVHSYYIHCEHNDAVLTQNRYSTTYHSAFELNNVLGVQFHPEKSHKFGKQLLKNFIEKY